MTRVSSHIAELERRIDCAGRAVADVGAGTGAFATAMAARGAQVVAIEIDPGRVAAIAALGVPGVTALEGTAQSLPLADACCDLVVFVFSFHHVPLDRQADALAEAARVLRPNGRLHVTDPLPEGPVTDLMRPIEDETVVRTRSQARLAQPGASFRLLDRAVYAVRRTYRDADAVIAGLVAVDPARAARLPAVEAEVRARIARHAEPAPEGLALTQPCALFHFERT